MLELARLHITYALRTSTCTSPPSLRRYTDIRAAFAEAIDSLDLGIPVLPADQAEARCTLLEAGDGDE